MIKSSLTTALASQATNNSRNSSFPTCSRRRVAPRPCSPSARVCEVASSINLTAKKRPSLAMRKQKFKKHFSFKETPISSPIGSLRSSTSPCGGTTQLASCVPSLKTHLCSKMCLESNLRVKKIRSPWRRRTEFQLFNLPRTKMAFIHFRAAWC